MMIVPSILSDSLGVVQEQLDKVALETKLRRVQVDIIDPEFADEITIHPIDLPTLDLKGLQIDIHLMTNDPINDVIECSQIPGITTIIAQIEHMASQVDFIEHVKSYSIAVGFSLDLHTDVEEIQENLFPQLDLIQVMGNKAGKQGESFLGEPILEKIRILMQIREKLSAHYLIAVDIGMSPDNAKLVEAAGADMVTPGSYLWSAPNLATAIEAYA
ncbi:MAG: hypothetical protein ABI758_03175 [Candidatus Woesebacteria bacterium]